MEVVTPLSTTDWTLIFDGVSISLDPSIGNWSFDCRSHYWISKNEVIWSDSWNSRKVNSHLKEEQDIKQQYYDKSSKSGELERSNKPLNSQPPKKRKKTEQKTKGTQKSIFPGKFFTKK
jgi:hypothetical protein